MLGISRRISGQVNDLQLREFLIQLIGIIDSLLPLFRFRNFCIIFMADIHDQDIRSFSIFKSIPHMPDILVSFDTLHLRNLSQHIFDDIQHFRLVIAYRNVHCMFPHVFRFSRFGELFCKIFFVQRSNYQTLSFNIFAPFFLLFLFLPVNHNILSFSLQVRRFPHKIPQNPPFSRPFHIDIPSQYAI